MVSPDNQHSSCQSGRCFAQSPSECPEWSLLAGPFVRQPSRKEKSRAEAHALDDPRVVARDESGHLSDFRADARAGVLNLSHMFLDVHDSTVAKCENRPGRESARPSQRIGELESA